MKIAILGASVSAQTITHNTGEVTGYAEVMRREHTGALGTCVIKQFTYPGNRLSDGGLLRLSFGSGWLSNPTLPKNPMATDSYTTTWDVTDLVTIDMGQRTLDSKGVP
ncbi:hypothetical protein rosmuc_00104 [Roseovarius mucosus DSM 17069]|uniref:Uncharacterized protein n=1 Tax=Roseovarius mucosus DSM 17069 TaxID=1288298 RepID=A0A0A0HTV0_9RHOB|nr:hypothetical protein [Roseovarius mucosus]KGM89513.1 hypothetical protein rosmuc_00104 [Roseovarius mucosus DSM 17069]